jgi:glycosyltransferase involved in cell wall biosynthesis
LALLRAFAANPPPNAVLVFAGDGEQRDALQTAAAASKAPVKFLPFANQSEMPGRYLIADVFVLPSQGRYETWGLAVNEAMHMGVPCLVSDQVGCQRDLVTEGETGWVFPAGDEAALNTALARAAHTLQENPSALRARVAARVARYTYAQATDGLMRAVQAALV